VCVPNHPLAEILNIGDFNIHHAEWLNSSSTDVGGSEALSFSHLNDLEQIIKHPTRVPDRLDQAPNTLDLFFTSNPQNYSYSLSSPLGSSDHSLLSVSTTLSPPSPLPPTSRRLWHWDRLQRNDLSAFLLDFPWEDCCFNPCDPSLAAGQIADIMVAFVPLLLNLSLLLNLGLIMRALWLFKLVSVHINLIYILVQLSLIKLSFLLGIVASLFFIRPSIPLSRGNVIT